MLRLKITDAMVEAAFDALVEEAAKMGHRPPSREEDPDYYAESRAPLRAMLQAAADAIGLPGMRWKPTHRHLKRGTEYQEVARGKLQTDSPLTDYADLVAYRDEQGSWWFRAPAEFDDGRFAALSEETRNDV